MIKELKGNVFFLPSRDNIPSTVILHRDNGYYDILVTHNQLMIGNVPPEKLKMVCHEN